MKPRPEPGETEVPPPSRAFNIMVGAVVGAVLLLITWAAAPDAVAATFSGPGPFLRVTAVIVGFMVFSRVVGRLVPNPWIGRAIVLVPALAVSWWALSPYVGDDVVNEAFPVVTADGADPDATAAPSPTADVDADADAPASASPSDDAATAEPAEEVASTPSAPIALGSGSFQGLTGHRGAGNATVFELSDGSRVLRLEDFDVSNGPGLEVYLVPGADQRGTSGGVKLADLKGNVGNQNYDVPADLDLTGDWTVLIWCAPFTVEVANATASF